MSRTPAHTNFVFQALLVLLGCASSIACTSGHRHAYHDVTLNLPFVGSKHVAVLALDQRPEVVSGERLPSFVGVHRETPDGQDAVFTASGEPLAVDVGNVVSRAFTRSGHRVETLRAAPGLSDEQGFAELQKTRASHLILISIRRWQTETFKNTQVVHDLGLGVYNHAGARQATVNLKGTDQLNASHHDSDAAIELAAQRALEQKLGILFSVPKIAQAFEREL